MNSFREQFGCDWLQYRNHLETCGIPVLASSKAPALSTPHPDTLSPETVPSPPPPEKESPQEVTEEVSVGLEPQEEEEMEEQGEEEEEEREQEQDEVEGELLVAVMVVCWEREENLGGGRASAQEGGVWDFAPLTGSLSCFLLSGALSPLTGVSPGGASGRAGQGALSPGYLGPPVGGGTPSSSNPGAAGAPESGGSGSRV